MPQITLTPEQLAKYLASEGQECPFCHKQNLRAGKVEHAYAFYQQVTCMTPECGLTWTDEYTLTGVSNVEKGE